MKKFLNFLKFFFGAIWVLVLVFFHIGIVASCGGSGDWFVGFVFILIWWILTAGTYIIYDKVGDAAVGGKGTYRKRVLPSRKALAVKTVLYVLWMLALVVIHIGLLGAYYAESGWIIWAVLIAVWWAVTIVTHTVNSRRVAKEESFAKAEYEREFISEIIVDDEFLGKMSFRYDSKFNELKSVELSLPPFGADSPDELSVIDYSECDRERIFRAVHEIYEHKDEILERIYPDLLDIAEEYGEVDENGDPYTLESIRKVTAVYGITVCNSENAFSVDLDLIVTKGTLELGGHAAEASVDFTKKAIYVGWG